MKKITFLFMLFSIFYANAQWVTDTAVNTLVSTDTSPSIDCKSIGTSDGKTFVVYWKTVPSPTNYELRAQLLDANGNVMFGPNGMLVSNTIPMGTYTSMWKINIDSNNNLYISVTGTGFGRPAYFFKIDTSGTLLWGANGLNIGNGYTSSIKPLSNGDVLISYFDGSQDAMQRVTSSGTPIWTAPVRVMPDSGTFSTVIAGIYELSSQDIIVVFHKILSFGTDSNLYAQKYNSSGVSQWAVPVQLSNRTTTFNNNTYSGLTDGTSVYFGYYSGLNNRLDSYLQKINTDGTIPWGINGMDFDINQTNFEMKTSIAYTTGSQYIWAICNYTNTSQTINGEYIQKFDKNTGARLFTDNAKEVFPISSNDIVHTSDLRLISDTPFFLTKNGMDNGASPTTLNLVKLDANGDFVWPSQFIPVATYGANKSQIDFTEPVGGESVTVFAEQKSAGLLIYAQKTDTTLSTDTFSANGFRIYPNPSNTNFNIEGITAIKSVAVYNAIGQQVYSANFNNITKINISTSNWANGIYVVEIKADNGSVKNYKLIKQ